MLTFSTLAILLPAAIMLHVTEEFLWPGGFIEWYKQFRPSSKGEINPGYYVWINTLMMAGCIVPLYNGDVAVWYCIAIIAAINACFHILGVIKLKKYSPGAITGVLLYIPLFIVGSWHLLSTGTISWTKAIIFIVLAIGYHIFSFNRQGR